MKGTTVNDIVDYYLQQLHGPDHENAYYALIHFDHSFVPRLIQAYRAETNFNVRVVLIEIIGQHRLSTTLDFLAEVLQDSDSEIWKAALDGIVTINGPRGVEVLIAEKERLLAEQDSPKTRNEWIEEAIEQIAKAQNHDHKS